MKTTIQNCADKILKIETLSISDTAIIINILATAMDEEKQNIIKTALDFTDGSASKEDAEKYYELTYTTNKETLK